MKKQVTHNFEETLFNLPEVEIVYHVNEIVTVFLVLERKKS